MQRSSAVRATTLAEFTQLLCARRAEIFRKLRNFFRASFAQNLRDPDALVRTYALFFSDLNAILTRSTLSDVVEYAQRTLAECTQFFVRGACRISGILQTFCANFCAEFA